MNETIGKPSEKTNIDEAFEKIVNSHNLRLPPRQQLWIAFRAGADWAMAELAKEIVKNPSNKEVYEESSG